MRWILDAVPTLWFPACSAHQTRDGYGPRLLCRLTIEGTRVYMDVNGPITVEAIHCVNDHCRAAHQWAFAQAKYRWPLLVCEARPVLRGDVWDVDITTLPSREECVNRLLHRNWIAHSKQAPMYELYVGE